MASSAEIKTTLCRLSYARDLFTARAVNDSQPDKKQFGCTLIFPKSDKTGRAALEALALETIKAEWGDKGIKWLQDKLIKTPFFDGAGPDARYKNGDKAGELNPGMSPDVWFIRVSAQANRPPAVVWKNPNKQEKEEFPDGVYSGCYGKAVVNAFTTDHAQGGKRLSFGIAMFQKMQEGELLGGAGGGPVNPEKWHETIADDGPAPDSTRTGDGAGGLFG
jgi:hypothetical protein